MKSTGETALKGLTYHRAANLMEADIGDELVALEPEGGNCFGFNEIAAWVWRRLAEPATFNQLRDALLEEYDVSSKQCTEELKALLDDLESKQLITAGGNNLR